jgi:hypothetical protein
MPEDIYLRVKRLPLSDYIDGEIVRRLIDDHFKTDTDVLPAAFDGQAVTVLSDPADKQLGPFARQSETSRLAALQAYPKQGSQRWWILAALAFAPSTREELEGRTGLPANSIRPRVRELIDGGWVVVTQERRKTKAGNESEVLRVADGAKDRVREHIEANASDDVRLWHGKAAEPV